MYERRRRIQTLESTKKFSKLQVRIELTTLRVLGSEFKYKFTRILGLHLGLCKMYSKNPVRSYKDPVRYTLKILQDPISIL